VKLITAGWDDATNAIADWDLALLPVSRGSESSRHPLAVRCWVTGKQELTWQFRTYVLTSGPWSDDDEEMGKLPQAEECGISPRL